jgi:hypothetical protein
MTTRTGLTALFAAVGVSLLLAAVLATTAASAPRNEGQTDRIGVSGVDR